LVNDGPKETHYIVSVNSKPACTGVYKIKTIKKSQGEERNSKEKRGIARRREE
jgi:hypothetical protein